MVAPTPISKSPAISMVRVSSSGAMFRVPYEIWLQRPWLRQNLMEKANNDHLERELVGGDSREVVELAALPPQGWRGSVWQMEPC